MQKNKQMTCPVAISNLLHLAWSLVELRLIAPVPMDTKSVLTMLEKLEFQ